MTADTLSDDAKAYYADGFRRQHDGAPMKVFSRRTKDGRMIRSKGSPLYDPTFDHPTSGVSRLLGFESCPLSARSERTAPQVPKPGPTRSAKLSDGQRVHHDEYGDGTIVERWIVVAFDSGQTLKLREP